MPTLMLLRGAESEGSSLWQLVVTCARKGGEGTVAPECVASVPRRYAIACRIGLGYR